jgi:hypothetical protein
MKSKVRRRLPDYPVDGEVIRYDMLDTETPLTLIELRRRHTESRMIQEDSGTGKQENKTGKEIQFISIEMDVLEKTEAARENSHTTSYSFKD